MDEDPRYQDEPTALPPGHADSSGGGAPDRVPEVGARSVFLALDPSGRLGSGIRLNDLDREEAHAPRLSGGAERYEVLRVLGRGGMGEVYLAVDRDLRRKVALKVIRGSGASLTTRFLEEAQILGQLEHPNIVAVHELGVTGRRVPYYTMPVVRGETLGDILAALRRRDPAYEKSHTVPRLVQVFMQVALALDYAHEKGVVHRDLKPANLMIGQHGEVIVLDWGLAKVLGRPAPRGAAAGGRAVAGAGGDAAGDPSLTVPGVIVGTPSYLSPEQADGEEVSPASDVYSLGVMLYEALTLSLPFTGRAIDVLAAHLGEAPVAPRERAPDRDVPLELERICLKALGKRPADRHRSARELHDELRAWLEAEADKAQRHRRAEERAAAGRERLAAWREGVARVRALDDEVAQLQGRFRAWQPIAEKAPLHAAEDRARAARDDLALRASEVVATLTEALGFEPDNAAARGLLADFYLDRFLQAEQAGDAANRDFYGTLTARYHDGRHARELRGDGSLALDSDPPGAEVWIHRLEERDLVLEPGPGRRLGVTPLRSVALPMGSFVAVLRRDGFAEARYPVLVSRNRDWIGRVRLHAPGQVGDGFVHVPAGPSLQGGDPRARGRTLPRHEVWVDDLFIARFPVTMEEYLAFLNDLARSDAELAARRAPRHGPLGAPLVRRDGASFSLPEVDAEGDRWLPPGPVVLVSWEDPVAYAAWRSRRDGVRYRLPDEREWEKAARGADGRAFPWGDRFDASLCNLRDSRAERAAPVAVDEFPSDVSVYGVRGLAGNVQEWTSTAIVIGEGENARDGRIVKGGGWDAGAEEARAATREWNTPQNLTHMIGFRLVRDGPLDA